MKLKSTGLVAFLCGQPWALHAPTLAAAERILSRHLEGVRLESEELGEIVRGRDARQARRRADWGDYSGVSEADQERGYFYSGNVAVVPVSGLLSKYSDMINGLSQPSGMTSQQVADTIRRAGDDRRASAGVLLDVDSPGGTVAGTSDMAQAVQDVKAGGRRVVAFAHDLAASAAYWLASQADEVFLTPTAEVGSIGVYAVLEDASKYYESRGVKRVLVASGPHKGGGADGTTLTPDHVASVAESVHAHAAVFKAAVAQGRGLSAEEIDRVATGRTFVGSEAVAAGLADGVANYEELVRAMNEKGNP